MNNSRRPAPSGTRSAASRVGRLVRQSALNNERRRRLSLWQFYRRKHEGLPERSAIDTARTVPSSR